MNERPHIAILGAGPIGLDAALAAAEAGLSFTVYERGESVGTHLRDWGHVRMFSPWALDLSPRLRAVLSAEPDPTAFPTGAEYAERVLEPVAASSALSGRLRTSTRVLAVSREGTLKGDEIGTGRRAERAFRLLLVDAQGRETTERADVVLDCTGTYGQPNPLGDGGIPAPGESALNGRITRAIPDLDAGAATWEGRRILLVGAGHSAQTAARDLADLATRSAGTRLLWVVRDESAHFPVIAADPLPERARLAALANALSSGANPAVEVRGGRVVEALGAVGTGVAVTLRTGSGALEEERVDRIVSLTGAVGDAQLYRQLQVHECYATAGLMKLSAALLGSSSVDCLAQEAQGIDTLVSPEPGFFVLGAKSYGRNNTFLLKVGFDQVTEVFAHLAAT